jgi:hypothetical protein
MRYFREISSGEVFAFDQSQIGDINEEDMLTLFTEVTGEWPPLPSPESLALDARANRDRMLKDCDWTQVLDCQMSDDDCLAWKHYRQSLRDITLQDGWPSVIVWPERPDEN